MIFTFTENGSLEVESDVEEIRGFDEGTYNYSVKNEPTYDIYENEISVNIENATFVCKIENGEMILDDSPLDGSIITLIKI